jgi:protein-glutamine gamma-glutamyltransferase
MRLDLAFRLSFYLTLALAGTCLIYTELPFLPEIAYVALPVAALLPIAFLVEGRWILPAWAANVLALVITAIVGIWCGSALTDALRGRLEGMALVLLMPYVGSFLLILMLALLFRPKRIGTLWFLQAMGLMLVALASSPDSEFLLGGLLLAYAASGTWCLMLFYLERGRRAVQKKSVQGQDRNAREVTAESCTDRVPWGALGTGQAGRRVLVALLVAVALFLLTPRSVVLQSEAALARLAPFQSALGDAVVDLNQMGAVHLNSAIAFEVAARDASGQPKLDLDPGTRWRGAALNWYERGKWFNQGVLRPGDSRAVRQPLPKPAPAEDAAGLPYLGAKQYDLTITTTSRPLRRVYLAEPVVLAAGDDLLPIRLRGGRSRPRPPALHLDRDLTWSGITRRETWTYVQRSVSTGEPGLGPRVRPIDREGGLLRQAPPVPGLRDWTTELLYRLAGQGKLRQAEVRTGTDGALLPRHHEKVARSLEAYLATSGEYTYTLQAPRRDRRMDPILDFLRNTREGHCERFAAALVVMLRSQGVPARLVVGYRGAESLGDGRYVVRHNNAHSWAEVLIQRFGPDGEPQWHWLTLDPTPGADTAGESDSWLARWWRDIEQGGGIFWRKFVMDYNSTDQDQGRAEVRSHLRALWSWTVEEGVGWLGIGLVVLLLLALLRRRRCRAPARGPSMGGTRFYRLLLQVAARRCRLRPQPAQTPHEFAELLGHHLLGRAAAAALAQVPAEVAHLYYRVRYALQPLSLAEQDAIEERIRRLDAALQT